MPAEENRNTLARQWEMLKMLPSRRPGITARELAVRLASDGFSVTKRTVERDLQALSGIFPLCCNDQSAPFGWYFTPGSSLELPGLSVAEALTLKLVEQHLTRLLPATMLTHLAGHFSQAGRKLDEMAANNPAARWAAKIRAVPPSQPLLTPEVSEAVLTPLQEALLHDRQVRLHYRKAGASADNDYTLSPLALLQRGPVTYLVAGAPAYQEPRLFALHRIRGIEVLEAPAERAADFDLDLFIRQGGANFGSGEEIHLRLHVDAALAAHLAEAPLAADMAMTPADDGALVEAVLPDTWQLRWWLLSQAEQAEVLAPPALRRHIRERLAAALARYDASPD